MAATYNYWRDPVLPWSQTEHDQRFGNILKVILITTVIFGVIIPFLPVPKQEKQKLEQVSPRLAKLIIERKKIKPPPPKKAVTKKTAPRRKKEKIAAAREKAQKSGLMAMSKEISALQDSFDMSALSDAIPLSTAGKQRTQNSSTSLAKNASRDSGGINTRALSKSTGNTQLANRKSSSVESTIKGSGGTGKHRTSSSATRGEEEIELVFQKNKGAIFSLYNRALRKDPTLQGKVVLELTIAPSGQVTRVRIISSDLNNKSLENKLIARVKLFRFAPRQVSTIKVTYPIDFLPS